MSTEQQLTDETAKTLEERVADLESEKAELRKEVQILRTQLDGMNTLVEGLAEIVAGEKVHQTATNYSVSDAKSELNQKTLVELVTDQQNEIETAVAMSKLADAEKEHSKTKKDVAMDLARNEAVRQAVTRSDLIGGVDITAPQVAEMGKPDVELAPKTIRDAMEKLEQCWDCFYFIEGDGRGRGDPNTLRLRSEELSPELARAVAHELDELDSDRVMNFVHNQNGE